MKALFLLLRQFVQTPLGKLKSRVEQLFDLHGIRFIETEESYTSKASFLDGDSLEDWKARRKAPSSSI